MIKKKKLGDKIPKLENWKIMVQTKEFFPQKNFELMSDKVSPYLIGDVHIN